jgi:hypothetical protein
MTSDFRNDGGDLFASRLLFVRVGVARPAAKVSMSRRRLVCEHVHPGASDRLCPHDRRAMASPTLLRD